MIYSSSFIKSKYGRVELYFFSLKTVLLLLAARRRSNYVSNYSPFFEKCNITTSETDAFCVQFG